MRAAGGVVAVAAMVEVAASSGRDEGGGPLWGSVRFVGRGGGDSVFVEEGSNPNPNPKANPM